MRGRPKKTVEDKLLDQIYKALTLISSNLDKVSPGLLAGHGLCLNPVWYRHDDPRVLPVINKDDIDRGLLFMPNTDDFEQMIEDSRYYPKVDFYRKWNKYPLQCLEWFVGERKFLEGSFKEMLFSYTDGTTKRVIFPPHSNTTSEEPV